MKSKVLFLALIVSAFTYGQSTGSIVGKLIDKEYNDEPLAFANVLIKGTTIGTTSDSDGLYGFENLSLGSYTLIYSFIGYETQEIVVEVTENKVTTVNVPMGASAASLDEVVITTTTRKESELVLLLEQKKAVEIKQTIGAQELTRKGVSDVANAVAKTSGVSKQECSNNIFVRGLGDRYNSTSINGLPVTSNDPEKKNISLDLFSTDIVEFISIDKVYGPKISGDFAGGNVDITSINYKGNGMFEFSLGSSIVSTAIDNYSDFKLQDGPNKFGFSNYDVPNNPLGGYNFNNSLIPVKHTPVGSSIGMKAGKSFTIGEQGSLNLFATASFDNGFEYREGINQSVSAQGAKLKSFNQERFAYTTNSTGMFNANYRINQNHKIAYNFLYVNSSSQVRDVYKGFIRDIAEDDNGLVQRGTYTQNTLFVNQLLGTHQLTDNIDFDWGISYNNVEGDMPDRTQNILKSIDNDNYVFAQNTITDNHRYYQNLIEDELAANLSVSYKLNPDENGQAKGKVTLGYNGRLKKRDFEAIQFNFRITGSQLNTVVDPENLDAFLNQENYTNGLFSIESFAGLTPQTYDGEQIINAGYTSLEYKLTDKLSSIIGLRYEKVEQTVSWRTQLDATGRSNTFNRNEFLPSVILKYELNEKQNLRFGASKTYTLPQFKERALFIYEDVTEVKVGNPDLYPSQNFNADLKWEIFPKDSEVISLTAFGKYILDPINEITLASSTNDISFINTGDTGYVYGAEFEIRKDIFNLGKEQVTNKFSAGFNASYMQTYQELDSEKVRKETNYNTNLTDDTSGFTGASDLLVNADISYAKDFKNDANIMATVAYSYFSDRLYALGVETKGNLVDKGVGTLDFILKTKINKNLGIDFTAKNLLNPSYDRVQENNGGDTVVMSFKRGAFFKLGLTYKL